MDHQVRRTAPVMRRLLALLLVVAAPRPAGADPIAARANWDGPIDYFVTGAPLAVDGPDADTTMVDTLAGPVTVTVGSADVPPTATVVAAYLYWAGTIEDQLDCATAPSMTDDMVMLTPPGMVAGPVTADVCYCAAGVASYDIQACRADVTALVTAAGMLGDYTVDGFAARITNGATDNASFSLVFVYEEADLLLPRRVALYDGVEELYLASRVITLAGLDIDNPAVGDLTWYVLDGDVGGAGPESVVVTGSPGGASATLGDAYNPFTNPMNHTINTTTPPRTDTIGVDIDRLDISAALAPTDTALDMTYTAGGDKYWVVFNLVGVNVYKPFISPKSTKTWALADDADASGDPSPGDTIRYTITLKNVGTAPALVEVNDPIPTAAESWMLVSAGGGTDVSTATTLDVTNVVVPPGGATVDVVFDMVLSPASAGTTVFNVVLYNALPDGNVGTVSAPSFMVGFGPADAGPPSDAPPAPAFDAAPGLDALAPPMLPDGAVAPAIDAAAPAGADGAPPGGADAATGPGDGNADRTGCGCRTTGGAAPRGGLLFFLALLSALTMGRTASSRRARPRHRTAARARRPRSCR